MPYEEFDWTGTEFDPAVSAAAPASDDPVEFDWSGTPFEEPKQAPPQGDLSAGLDAGVESWKSLRGGLQAAVGAVLGNDDWLVDGLAAMDAADRRGEEIAQGHITRFEDVQSVSDFIDYAQYGLATLVPMAAESAVSAAAGAMLGSATAPGPGTAVGFVGGLMSRQAVKTLAKRYAQGKLKELGKEALEAKAKKDLLHYAKGEIKDKAHAAAIQKAVKSARANVGAKLGALASEYSMGVGDVYSSLDEGDRAGAQEDAGLAFGLAVPYALIGAAPEAIGIDRLFNQGKGGLISRIAKAAAVQAPVEGVSEVGQEEINIRAKASQDPTFDIYGPEAQSQRLNAAVLGTVGGGVFGAVTGLTPPAPDPTPIQNATSVEDALAEAERLAAGPTIDPGVLERRGFEDIAAGGLVDSPLGPDIDPTLLNARVSTARDDANRQLIEAQYLDPELDRAKRLAATGLVSPAQGPNIDPTLLNKRGIEEPLINPPATEPVGAELDQLLRNELRRANGLPVDDDQAKNLAATQLDTAPNTQIQDQLVEQGAAKRAPGYYKDEIAPKAGYYRTQAEAEHALRGKRQTPDPNRQEELKNFAPVERQPGQWVLARRQGQAQENTPQATQTVPAPQDRTVTRAEVAKRMRAAGVSGLAQQQEVFAELTPADRTRPNEFRLADVTEVLNRYQLDKPTGQPVATVGLAAASREAFPTAKVASESDNEVVLDLPNGTRITVRGNQEIEVDEASAREGYGEEYQGERKATGSYTRAGRDGILRLSKDADQGTVDHEAFHAAWLLLTDKERKALIKRYGSEEKASRAYAKWKPEQPHGIFRKILRLFRKIRDAVLGPSATGTMERVATGEVFNRPAAEAEGTSYQLDPKIRSIDERISALQDLKACLSA